MNNQLYFIKMMKAFKRRFLIVNLWDGIITGLLFSLAPAVLSAVKGYRPWYSILFLISLILGLIFRYIRSRNNFYHNVDSLTGSNGEIITLKEYIKKDEPNNFIPLLFARIRKRLEGGSVKNYIPLNPFIRIIRTLVLLAVLYLILFLPALLKPAEPGFHTVLSNAALRLSEASEKDSSFTPMAEYLNELEENMPEDEKELYKEKQDLKDLSKELTEQVRELERNSLTKLFEERGKTRADAMERLLRGDMSLPETRELIIDLLSAPEIDKDRKKAIQQSFQDYSESTNDEQNTRGEKQQKLAEDLMDDLDPQGMELAKELKDIIDDLNSLTEESADTAENTGNVRESRSMGAGGADSQKQETETSGAATTAAGSKRGKQGEGDRPFEPLEGESPEARLPEGEIIQRKDQGVLRLEGSENFQLERVSPDYPAGKKVNEDEIPILNIPREMRQIVRDYFTSIGSEPLN